jgi:hypothetical protein
MDVAGYHYSKARLPKGESYPLRRGELDGLLSGASIERLRHVYYGRGTGSHVMGASFMPDGARAAAAGTTTLFVHSVPSELREDIHATLLAGGARRIIDWLEAAEGATQTWRFQGHYLRARYSSERGALNLSSDEGGDELARFQI